MSPALVSLVLARASIEAAALVAAVALFVGVAPRIPAGTRCALWWLASLRALIACFGLPSIGVPIPSLVPSAAPAIAARAAGAMSAVLPAPLAGPVAPPLGSASTASVANSIDAWAIVAGVLAAIWLVGALVVALRHAAAARRLGAIWRAAEPLESAPARAWLRAWLGAGFGGRVELRVSGEIRSPLALGGRRPRILLPDSCRDLSRDRARMALAHEASHLRRGDLWWSWVPALAECVFWFHPLVRLGAREYVQAREEACDAQALRWSAAEPEGYGDMLLGFGVDPSRLVQAVSCGSPHVRHLERRLHMLAHATLPGRARRAIAAAALVVFGAIALIPVRLVAAHAGDADASRSTTSSKSVTNTNTRTSSSSTGVSSSSSSHSRVVKSGEDPDSYESYGYYTKDQDGVDFSFGLMTGGTQNFSGSISGEDGEAMEKVRAREQGRFLWFRLAGKDYVTHDSAALDQVREIMRPQGELGRRQGALGDQQSRLGEKQSDLGERQSKLGEEQSRISERASDLAAKIADGGLTRAEREALDREIDDLRARVDAISDAQSKLGDLQSELGAQQSDLGSKQSEMGRLQSEASVKIQHQMRDLAGRLVKDGRAKVVAY